MREKNQFNSVEEYFNAQPEKIRQKLIEINDCIMRVAPHASTTLNYDVPAYTLIDGGKREQQIMIAGYKEHVGLYPHPTTMEKFDSELIGFKKGKGSVQFPVNKPLPKDLIERMIEYRLGLLKK